MTWVKIDDAMNQNAKVRSVSLAARWAYVSSICRSGATVSDGEIRGADLSLIDANPKIAKELVAAGLWETTSRGSYVVHDYLVYNRSRLQIEELKRTNSANGAKRSTNRPANRLPDGSANGSKSEPQPQNARSVSSANPPVKDSLTTKVLPEGTPSDSLSDSLAPKTKRPASLAVPKRPFGEAELCELREKYGPKVRDFDGSVRKAMRSPAYQFTADKYGHIEDWLLTDIQRRNGNGHQLRTNPQQNNRMARTAPGPERVPDLVVGD